jgi:hypothetical protein
VAREWTRRRQFPADAFTGGVELRRILMLKVEEAKTE